MTIGRTIPDFFSGRSGFQHLCPRLAILFVLCTGFYGTFTGCTGYGHAIRETQEAVARGQMETALEKINQRLNVSDASELPSSIDGNQALYLLERGTILQAMGRYDRAARDMMVADNHLDYLDLNSADALELGKYLYSESATTYRAPAYERLLLNALNMINFLIKRDYQGAKVEARRFALIEHFFVEEDEQQILPKVRALGNYLGGVSFERAGDYQEAARYYSFAYHLGFQTPSLRDRLIALFALTGYHPGELRSRDSDALSEITTKAAKRADLSADAYREKYLPPGDTIAVVQTGMVPYREIDSVSVQTAIQISMVTGFTHLHLRSSQAQRFRALAAAAGISYIRFPGLRHRPMTDSRSVTPSFPTASNPDVEIFPKVPVAEQVKRSWENRKGALMAAAITRFITRLAAAGLTMKGAKEASGSRGFGFLAGILSYMTLQAMDVPDTRSWRTLAGHISLLRTTLEPKTHRIEVRVGENVDWREVDVRKRDLTVVNFSRLR